MDFWATVNVTNTSNCRVSCQLWECFQLSTWTYVWWCSGESKAKIEEKTRKSLKEIVKTLNILSNGSTQEQVPQVYNIDVCTTIICLVFSFTILAKELNKVEILAEQVSYDRVVNGMRVDCVCIHGRENIPFDILTSKRKPFWRMVHLNEVFCRGTFWKINKHYFSCRWNKVNYFLFQPGQIFTVSWRQWNTFSELRARAQCT